MTKAELINRGLVCEAWFGAKNVRNPGGVTLSYKN